MAQLPLETLPGRSSSTPRIPRPIPSAIRDDDVQGTGMSTPGGIRPQYVAPTAQMTSSTANRDNAERIPHVGKGKEQAILPVSEQISASDDVNDRLSERARPVLESDITSDSEEQALADARRYQAQVDRSERRRDREDADFDPLGNSRKRLDHHLRESGRKRSRKVTQSKAAGTPSGQRLAAQQEQTKDPQSSFQQKQSVPQKRKADFESPSERIQHPSDSAGATSSRPHEATNAESEPEHKRYTSERHQNKQFTKLKPESQSKRKQYLRNILKRWKITLEQLMTFPYAPRRTVILEPLDWNSGLLEAVARLALNFKGKFAKACEFAKEALERSSPRGTKQMTAKILLDALVEQEATGGNRQETTGATIASTLQSVTSVHESAIGCGSGEARRQCGDGGSSPHQLAGPSGDHRDARSRTSSVQPPSPPSPTVQPSDTAGQAPPSPVASPVVAPATPLANAVVSEAVDANAQQDVSLPFSSQSSVTEERLDLESRAQILSHQLAIVRVQMERNERRRREKERRVTSSEGPSGSASQPLVF